MNKLRLVTAVAIVGLSIPVRDASSVGSFIVSAAGTPGITAQASPPDACKLFTLEEIGKTLGRSFRRARPGTQSGGTTCAFLGGTDGTINVSVSQGSSSQEFDEFRKTLIEQGEKVDPVSGVGDDAYFWGARIYVRVASRWLVIWNSDPNQPAEKARADALAVAKLGAGKLRSPEGGVTK